MVLPWLAVNPPSRVIPASPSGVDGFVERRFREECEPGEIIDVKNSVEKSNYSRVLYIGACWSQFWERQQSLDFCLSVVVVFAFSLWRPWSISNLLFIYYLLFTIYFLKRNRFE
jgi:hypothetical protein